MAAGAHVEYVLDDTQGIARKGTPDRHIRHRGDIRRPDFPFSATTQFCHVSPVVHAISPNVNVPEQDTKVRHE